MNITSLRQKAPRSLIAVLLLTAFAGNIVAQSGTTFVSGTVFDQRGKVVLGATVTLANPGSSFSRTTKTNETGTFSFPAVQPGIYRLQIEMTGFKKFVRSEVRALA